MTLHQVLAARYNDLPLALLKGVLQLKLLVTLRTWARLFQQRLDEKCSPSLVSHSETELQP